MNITLSFNFFSQYISVNYNSQRKTEKPVNLWLYHFESGERYEVVYNKVPDTATSWENFRQFGGFQISRSGLTTLGNENHEKFVEEISKEDA